MLSVKSGQGQLLVNPGEGRWLIVQLPYGQALSPTSHVAVPAGEYEISLFQQGKFTRTIEVSVNIIHTSIGLDCYPRPEIQQLNWDKEDKTKRDPNVRTFLRRVVRAIDCADLSAFAAVRGSDQEHLRAVRRHWYPVPRRHACRAHLSRLHEL